MSVKIPPWFMKLYPGENFDRICKSSFFLEYYRQFLIRKGVSRFITGRPDSGKTQKLRYHLKWLAPLETPIWFDTGKPGDLQLLLTLGKPVQILIPHGCRLEIVGKSPAPIEVMTIPDPVLYWKFIKKDHVNIISICNFFLDDGNFKRYTRAMFKNYILNSKLGGHSHFTPACLCIDEAHAILGSGRVDSSADAKQTGQDTATIMRLVRAMGERWIIASQSYYDVQGGARENALSFTVCRGTKCDRRDNEILHYLQGFAERCEVYHGWEVMPNGRYFGATHPLRYPYFEPAPVRVIYQGFVDDRREVSEDDELMERVDFGIFGSQMIPGEPVPVIPSRFEVGDLSYDD